MYYCHVSWACILLSVIITSLTQCSRGEESAASERVICNLGRSGDNVFRATGGTHSEITQLQLGPSWLTADFDNLPQLPKLNSLRLIGWFSNDRMVTVARCNHLRELYLHNTFIRARGISQLSEKVPLETLWIVSQDFTDDMAAAIVTLRTLKTLIIVTPTSLGESVFKILSRHPALEELHLTNVRVSGALETELRHVATIRTLRVLHLSGREVTDSVVKAVVESTPELHCLHLDHSTITDEASKSVGLLPSLQELSVRGSTNVTNTFVESVCNRLKLRHLDVGGTSVTPSALKSISRCRELESLGFSGVDADKGTIIDFQAMASLTQLRALDLRWVNLTRNEMKVVAELPELEVFSWRVAPSRSVLLDTGEFVTNESPLVDDIVSPLSSAKKLRTLRIKYVRLSNAGLSHLARIKNLQRLDCASTSIDDQAAECLSSMKGLESLDCSETNIGNKSVSTLLRLPKLRELDIGATLVTDDAFAELPLECSIRYMDLTNTFVTDLALETLTKSNMLRFLILNNSKVTTRGIERLIAAKPTMYASRHFVKFGLHYTENAPRPKVQPREGDLGVERGLGIFIDGETASP